MASDEKVESLTEAVDKLRKVGQELAIFFKSVDETMRELVGILMEQDLQPAREVIRDPEVPLKWQETSKFEPSPDRPRISLEESTDWRTRQKR